MNVRGIQVAQMLTIGKIVEMGEGWKRWDTGGRDGMDGR